MMKIIFLLAAVLSTLGCQAQRMVDERPRVLISTDIGGTDPDDNQSMIHLMMYSDLFQLEGLVSSPSFGNGSKQEILRMIDLYAKDYPQLKKHTPRLMSPKALRKLCKQGRHGLMPYKGYAEPTEGSQWIIRCARKESSQPLWVLVWGTLEDVAQALHDAPDIASKIRVYWIDGPNNPTGESWGGSFALIRHSSRRVFHRQTSERDTVPVYSVVEWYFQGPVKTDITEDSVCLTATIDKQQWAGYYLGNGTYVLRYSPKAPARLTYSVRSQIAELNGLSGWFIVDDVWPGKADAADYPLGANWYSDRPEREFYEGKWQGAKTLRRWRQAILEDWAMRWEWLKK